VVEVGQPVVFILRAHNTSRHEWQFKAGSREGIHAGYLVAHFEEPTLRYADWAGFLDATVPPGGYIDLALPVPPPPEAGRYGLWVDLSFKKTTFTQYGSEPLTHDWEARDPAPAPVRPE
jgi:hypothetical protein